MFFIEFNTQLLDRHIFMKNLSSINHNNFSKLHELTNSYNKATLLDKLIYWWQISTFTLPNNPHIWFTRSRERIAEESKLSLRTIDRYLNEFTTEGLIEKTNKLFIKKNLYIRITDKLLLALGLSSQDVGSTFKNISPTQTTYEITKELSIQEMECKKTTQHGSIDTAMLAVPIYKEQDNNLTNSTVRQDDNVNNFKKELPETTNNQSVSHFPKYPIEKIIGEQLTPQFTNYIKGTLKNLTTQHNIKASSPEQLYAEVVFAVLNKQHQFVGIPDNNHRINLIAKLIRENRWRTPKGFYNHSEIGKHFKTLQPTKNNLEPGLREGGGLYKTTINHMANTRINGEIRRAKQELQDINNTIQTETRYLNEMTLLNDRAPSKMTQMVLDSIKVKLIQLKAQKAQLDIQPSLSNAA